MLSELSGQLLSGREYNTVLVFCQSDVSMTCTYTIPANGANYKRFFTAGKPHAQKLTENKNCFERAINKITGNNEKTSFDDKFFKARNVDFIKPRTKK